MKNLERINMEPYSTLSTTIYALNKRGFKEDFVATENEITAVYSKKSYQPLELRIIEQYRFEGMTNPADSSAVFAIEAFDGTKGTLTLSYGSDQNQNADLIKRIPVE